jgi:uncharacterized protein (TIGR00730 family)
MSITENSKSNYRNHRIEKALKGYDNRDFIHSKDGRVIRLLSEYLYPKQVLERHQVKKAIIFFGSARMVSDDTHPEKKRYFKDAREIARLLTEWSHSLPKSKRFYICTGGGPGIMEAANLGSHEAGGKSIGLNISLPFEQKPNQHISKELNLEFHYFFMRKFWFVFLANAMLVFPGGFGTLDELMEILTLRQTHKVTKPLPIFLYGQEYWEKLINWDYLVELGMISPDDKNLFTFVNSPQEAFEKMKVELSIIHKL